MSATSPAQPPFSTPLRPNVGAASPQIFTSSDRFSLIAVIVAAVLAAASALIVLVNALEWRSQPFLGVLVTRGLMVDGSIPLESASWAAFNAGLQRGDHLLGINDVMFQESGMSHQQAFERFRQTMDDLFFRQAITVSFRRPVVEGQPVETGSVRCTEPVDGYAPCTAIVIVQQFSDTDFIGFFAVPFVSGLVVLGAGLGMLILRPNTQVTRMTALVLLCLSIFISAIFDLNTAIAVVPLWIVATTLGSGVLIALALIFPVRTALLVARPNLRFVPPIFLGLIGLGLAYLHLNPTVYTLPSLLTLSSTAIGLVGMTLFSLRILLVRRRTASLVVRDQTNTILIGMALALTISIVWISNLISRTLTGADVLPLNTSAMTPFFMLPALSLAYASLQYRLLDSDRLISQTITYAVMLAGLIGGYFLLVYAASLITQQAIGADNPVLIATVIFAIAALFVPIRTRLQERIDRLYFRRRINYQARVEEFAQQISELAGITEVLAAYRKPIDEVLQPQHVLIFLPNRQRGDYGAVGQPRPETDIRFTADSPLLDALRTTDGALMLGDGSPWPPEAIAERARLLVLKAALIMPLKGASGVNGFVILSQPQGEGRRYTYEQLRFLQGITSSVSVAVERAQVVESLERRVNQLDVLSSVSQAINFTVEFDDLLELIATQTNRLIAASHFYIALRDRTGSSWQYAFFLENADRQPEKEQQWFSLGRDLISDVLRTRQPIRVDNYPAALAERGITAPYEDPALRAWMAVPLLVGNSASGVLATGTLQIGQPYTNDQLKSFNDIAALAAASIEKVRLFTETTSRARQLAALNDISQKLVASESDIETLLKLITASSADIIDAEAGSLLLTTDREIGELHARFLGDPSPTDVATAVMSSP